MCNPDGYSGGNNGASAKEYLKSFEIGLKLLNETKEEIKVVLNGYIKLGRGIGMFTQNELVEILAQIDDWDNVEWYGIATQLMDNGLLDPVYVRCIYCFVLYENQLCNEKLRSEITNNPELLNKYNEQVQIRIRKILEGE